MASEPNKFKATVKQTLRHDIQPWRNLIFKFDSGMFDAAEGKALEDEHGNLIEFHTGDRVEAAYESSQVPYKLLSVRKLAVPVLPLEPNTHLATVKGVNYYTDGRGTHLCFKLDNGDFDMTGPEALDYKHGHQVEYDVGDRVKVTYEPATIPELVVAVRKVEEN